MKSKILGSLLLLGGLFLTSAAVSARTPPPHGTGWHIVAIRCRLGKNLNSQMIGGECPPNKSGVELGCIADKLHPCFETPYSWYYWSRIEAQKGDIVYTVEWNLFDEAYYNHRYPSHMNHLKPWNITSEEQATRVLTIANNCRTSERRIVVNLGTPYDDDWGSIIPGTYEESLFDFACAY